MTRRALFGFLVALAVQTVRPAAPRDLETWSFYDLATRETETGLYLVVRGNRGGTVGMQLIALRAGRTPTERPRELTIQLIQQALSANRGTEVAPTLKITTDAGKPSQVILDLTSRVDSPVTDSPTGRRSTSALVTPRAEGLVLLAEAETVRITVFNDDFTLRPDQIGAIRAFAERVAVVSLGGGPTLTIDKKRFATAEPLLLWAGVKVSGTVPASRQQPGTLTITRPDKRTRTETVPWPTGGISGRSWTQAVMVDRETPQAGEYRAVFTLDGRDSAPVYFVLEDVPILRQIEATVEFPSPFRLAPGGTITLVIANKSRETIRVAKRGGRQGPVMVELNKTDRSTSRSLPYPEPALLAAVGLPAGASFPLDELTWATAGSFPTDLIRPGATVRVALPLAPLLSAIQPALAAGEYEVTISTLLTVLIAERGGPWSDVSPVRIEVTGASKGVR